MWGARLMQGQPCPVDRGTAVASVLPLPGHPAGAIVSIVVRSNRMAPDTEATLDITYGS